VACLAPPFLEVVMEQDTFDAIVRTENEVSVEMLIVKAIEYADQGDRLSNFKKAAGIRGINPADALVGMLVKHFVSVSDMAKTPHAYSLDTWNEKLRDIRNYTYLLKAVLLDIGVNQ
jgi:hypothetical protein